MSATFPLYVAQTRMSIVEKGKFKGLADCLLQTIRQEGFSALFKGYDAAILRVFPECGISLMGYMTLREHYVPEGQTPTVYQSLLFGALSSTVSQTVAAPMLTARTRLMTQGASMGRPVLYNNVFDAFRKIVYGDVTLKIPAEGYRALYRGHPAYLLKMIPGTAIQFAAFEVISKFLSPYF
jgi:hypothetical protein